MSTPTGNVDVAPTVAYLLGLAMPQADGRVINEALAFPTTIVPPSVTASTIQPGAGVATGLAFELPTDPTGGTRDAALTKGVVDAYPEYTGTALTSAFKVKVEDVPKDPAEAFEQAIEPVDVVYDLIGGDVAKRSLEVLHPDGRLICLPSASAAGAMAAAADRRADLDLHINLLTEHELTKLTVLVAAIAEKLDVRSKADPELGEITKDVQPLHVLDALDARAEP